MSPPRRISTCLISRQPSGDCSSGLLAAAALLCAAMAVPLLAGRVYVADDLGEYHLPLRAFYAQQLAGGRTVRLAPLAVQRILSDRAKARPARIIRCIWCSIAFCRSAWPSTWNCSSAIR